MMSDNADIQNFEISVMCDEVKAQLEKMKIKYSSTEQIDELITIGSKLWHPQAALAFCSLERIDQLGNVRCVNMNKKSVIIQMNEAVQYIKFPANGFFFIYTIGDEITKKINELKEKGEQNQAMILSVVAIVACGKIKYQIIDHVESEANKSGLRVGPYMNPGSVKTWDVHEQLKVFEITEAQRMKMSYNSENGFMSPVYSSSGLIPISFHYKSTKVTSMCFQCSFLDCHLRNINNSYIDIEDV